MKKSKKILKVILIIIGCYLGLTILVAFAKQCAETTNNSLNSEKLYPVKYLEISSLEMSPSLFGDKFTIKYKIKNTAIETTYKDINIEITYYNENRDAIEISTTRANSAVLPNSEQVFELERIKYKNLKTISMKIKSAKGVD